MGALVPLAGGSAVAQTASSHTGHGSHDQSGNRVVGEVNHVANGFDPHKIVWDFDVGTVSTMSDGRKLAGMDRSRRLTMSLKWRPA